MTTGIGASNYPQGVKMKAMNNIKFSSNIFTHPKGRKQMGSNLSKEQGRLCSTCGRYKDKKCKYIGKIKNPDCGYCSWYLTKEHKENKINNYISRIK